MQKTLLLILDGLGDRPVKKLGGKTPLEAAHTPNMDRLASGGTCGLMNAMPKNLYPTSEESHLALLGYDFKADYPGRGVLEALGIGIKLKKDELAFRANVGTVDERLNLVDPRAGVIDSTKNLLKTVNNIEIDGVTFTVYPSLQHRAVLVLSGNPVKRYLKKEKKAYISDTDPHKAGPRKLGVRILTPKSTGDTKEGKTVARALERYQQLSYEILKEHKENKRKLKKGKLPANFILTRGCGHLKEIDGFKKKFGLKAACVAGAPLYKGIASYLGMKVLKVRGATGTFNSNYGAKFKAAKKALKKNDFVFLHIKATDMAAEDFGDALRKKEVIEKVDLEMGRNFKVKDVTIAITGDHSTPCELRDHSTDPVPLLIFDGESRDSAQNFGETECKKGKLGHIYGKDFMGILLKRKNV